MTPERFAMVAELFDELRELPEEARSRALTDSGADQELRDAVLALLRHDSPTEEFLGRPALHAAADLLTPLAEYTPLAAPERIGGYRVLRRLGQGGFGTVLLAEQASPRRLVALKLMRPGAGEEETRRFTFESEALARLDHPGIARVYESGVVEVEGHPTGFIAMEYVEGSPLDEHLREADPPLRERLELLAGLSDAIEHAHIRGVVHRDLAPKNILVTRASPGNAPAVKVIDFGLARELRRRDQLSRVLTLPGSIVGTLRYMSPEQLAGGGEAADTRTDLYAMGVIAYEALAGGHPYLKEGEPIGAAVRLLQEGPARRASEIRAGCGRELDAVLLKSVDRSADRRYQTAGAFAADLRNLAADRPVTARPAGLAYRAAKFCKRNRWGVLAGAAALAVLGGACGVVWHARAQREESRAAAANVMETLVERLLSPLAPQIGTLAEREELLRAVGPDVEVMLARSPSDPRTLRVYGGYAVLAADVHRERGRLAEAHGMYLRAADCMRRLVASGAATFADVHQCSLAVVKLGDAEWALGRSGRALYEEALGIDMDLVRAAPEDVRALSNLFWSHLRVAAQEEDPGGPSAENHRARAFAIAQRMVAAHPESWRSWDAWTQACITRSVRHYRAGRHAEAAAAINEAVDAAAHLVAMEPRAIVHHSTLIHACRMAITAAMEAGDVERARALLVMAEASEAALRPAAEDPYVEYAFRSGLDASRAWFAYTDGDLETAVELMGRRVAVLEIRHAAVPTDPQAMQLLIHTLGDLVVMLTEMNRPDEASEAERRMMELVQRAPDQILHSKEFAVVLESVRRARGGESEDR